MVGKGRQRRSTVKILIKGRAGGCQLSFSSLQNLRFAFPCSSALPALFSMLKIRWC
jgi:hypothetical protein